jgi:hypothetical protein
MIFLTPAAFAYSRMCFVPLLADSTADLASSIVFPFTWAELAIMRVLTPIVPNEISECSIIERKARASKDICQIVVIKIRDTYGFKSALVFQVRDTESRNPLRLYCPEFLRIEIEARSVSRKSLPSNMVPSFQYVVDNV